jgi:CRISPR system Cascade subunit CasC
MKMKKVYVDFHVIQTVPPSCLNRDDTGSPKTAVYGGVQRARVSSQAWKYAMRWMFKDHFDQAERGKRTKSVVNLVAKEIREQDRTKSEEDSLRLAKRVVFLATKKKSDKKEKKKNKTEDKTKEEGSELDALFFISEGEVKELARLIIENNNPPEEAVKSILMKDRKKEPGEKLAVDIALFGRMLANDSRLNMDASAQVAHSISTHKMENEYDYFTAIDDNPDNSGAAMLGTVEYNSATLYRYATIAAHELFMQLAEDEPVLEKTVAEFARAFITSMPTGRQNGFANRTLPDAVLVAVRSDQPVNLVGAFEQAVKSGKNGGFAEASAQKLETYAQNLYNDFCGTPVKSYVVGSYLDGLGEKISLPRLLELLGKDTVSLCKNAG